MAKWLFLITMLLLGLECWTEWFDIDNPWDGDGDFEIIQNILNSDVRVCSGRMELDVRTITGVSANKTKQNFLMYDLAEGFVCVHRDQPSNLRCEDYKIRYKCPISFYSKNEVECWTDWFSRDHGKGTGEWETLADLYTENPGQICAKPLDIEAVTVKDGFTPKSFPDVLTMSAEEGLVCKAADNPQGCQDYKVRFKCPLEFCLKEECWTDWFVRGRGGDLVSWGVLSAIKSRPTDQFCKEILSTEIKGIINNDATPFSKLYDQKGNVNAYLYHNQDISYEVRYMCNIGHCTPEPVPVQAAVEDYDQIDDF
ncbi:hypothetical protein WMY93_028911 [Mugilogobius chulae]|uniref:WxxW domain-containing protein n=1 Tax=Mugilogobius chulae TaxID=88201 RepID=A0AAW0N019_9GOBI